MTPSLIFDPKTTLFASDMDGTLLDASGQLSAASRTMLNQAASLGARFTVATARTPATVDGLLQGLHMELPAVVMTGAATWHRDTGRWNHLQPIPTAQVDKLLAVYDRLRLPTFVYTLRGGVIQVYHTGPLTDRERAFIAERLHTRWKQFHIPPSGISMPPYTDGDVLLLFAMHLAATVEPVYEALRHDTGCTPVCYRDTYRPETALLEVFAPQASKAEAVQRLARDRGLSRIVAFGDNLNDLPLMRAADVAVAVENALPQVKAEADIIIGPNTSDAVPRFILDHLS